MRKLIAMLMALMMLFGIGAACAEGEKTGEETPAVGGPAVGSWAAAENTEITPDELAVFDKAIEGLMGVKYEPVLLLGTQVVAGTNYAFLCKGTVVYPDALPYWYILYVYEDLQGNVKVLDIENLELAVPSLTNAAE
jgi:hypothetical protein